MTWMSLPVTSYDKYVDPVNGDDGNSGNTWAAAYQTCSRAASQSGSHGRIWLAPGDHTITSTIVYEQKKLQWIGPPIPSGFEDPSTGAARITGSGLDRYFDTRPASTGQANVHGGGFRSIMFDLDGINSGNEAIRARQLNYAVFQNLHGRASSGSHRNVYLIRETESNYAAQAADQDRSWWTVRDVHVFNCGLIYRDQNFSAGSRGANAWNLINCHGTSDATNGATIPYFVNYRVKASSMVMMGGSYYNTASGVAAIVMDQTGETADPSLTMIGVTFSDLRTPYLGLQAFGNSAVNQHLAIQYPGGNGTTDGVLWADANCTGFYAGPASGISGVAGNSLSIGAF